MSNPRIEVKYDMIDSILKFETNFEMDGIVQEMYKEVVDFKEKVIREKLIELGWTPPK